MDKKEKEVTTMGNVTTDVSDSRGYFIIDNRQFDTAPEDLLAVPPRGKRYAEVFQENILCLQMERTPFAKKIIMALDETKVHYKATATMSYLRLFFQGDFGMPIHFGYNMTGVEGEMCSTKGYIEHVDGKWTTLHDDTELSELPDWLYPTRSVSALYSKTSRLGQSQWIDYVTPIFQRYRGGYSQTEKRSV